MLQPVSRPPFAQMYWTPAQLAQLTSNGANVRTGDLYASGAVSGADTAEWGSCLELSWNATSPFTLSDGTTRTFLDDGDTVTISASAPGISGRSLCLGDLTGTVAPNAVSTDNVLTTTDEGIPGCHRHSDCRRASVVQPIPPPCGPCCPNL